MTDLAAVYEAILGWVALALRLEGVDEAVAYVADQSRQRARPPSLTVKVIAWDVPAGQLVADRAYTPDGLTLSIHRAATLSIQGYGAQAFGWLETLGILVDHDETIALLGEAGLDVRPLGGVTDLSQIVDTATERRCGRDFEIVYRQTTTPSAFAEATTINLDPITFERYDGSPDPLTTSLAISIPT